MKKVAAIFLLILFLIANSGVAVSLHWCGKKLASVEFFPDLGHNCPCGKRAMKPGCCKDKTIQLKAKNDLVKTNLISLKIATSKIPFCEFNHFNSSLPTVFNQITFSDFYHPPPYKPKAPVYLLNSVLII